MRFFIIGMLVLVHACTGQKPADLKRSTSPRTHIKAACSDMKFEGQVLSKNNVLNIFECSGWINQYPALTAAIKDSDEETINQALKVFNDSFFASRQQRSAFYELTAESEIRGELDTLSAFLNRALTEHSALGQVNKVLSKDYLASNERSDLYSILSASNTENLKIISALKHLAQSFEASKSDLHELLTEEDKNKLVEKFINLFDDFAGSMAAKNWNQLSKIIFSDESVIQNWAVAGLNGDLRILLDVIKAQGFVKDVTFLKNSLDSGIVCTNQASSKNFLIDVGQELKHKIEGLKTTDREEFEKILLHGLTKYLAFQEFCEEKDQTQGLTSFFKVINHAFNVLSSEHDYIFLKKIHQIFGADRFVFLSFLSSKSFSSLRDLFIEVNDDENLVSSLYEVLSKMPEADLRSVSSLVNELSLDQSSARQWYLAWAKLWSGLSAEEKKDFTSFLGVLLSEDLKASDILHILENVFKKFPHFSANWSAQLKSGSYQTSFHYLVKQLSSAEVQSDLARLLSNKGLFEFIGIMTQDYQKPVRQAERLETELRDPTPYVSRASTGDSLQTKVCFAALSKTYEQDTSYYNLVNNLPEACLNILGEVGFVGHIYLWMNASDAYFRERFGVEDFHAGTGVWAPGMLQFLFSTAVKADFVLMSEQGKQGILANLDSVHKTVTDPRLLELVHQFSLTFKHIDSKLNLDPRILQFVSERDNQKLNSLVRDGFALIEPARPLVNLNFKPTRCDDLSPDLGVEPCLSEDIIKTQLIDILRILKRPNEKNVTLAKELIRLIHPDGGVPLPFGQPAAFIHRASIEELIRFLYDLSSEKTIREFSYLDENSKKSVKGSVLDRLEVVIRDIAFTNNFYGAYFKNDVASAKDYRKDVIKSEKLLVMLDRSGGVLRVVNGMTKDSKYRLKNVRSTYSSLVEVSDTYVQPDGSTRTYGPLIQSLLAIVADSSKVSTQSFNPYRVPNPALVEGHNGWFLTKIVELSGLRHMAAFVRSHFDDRLTALDTEEFKKINKNLVGRHDLLKIQNGLQDILDKYLDNDRSQLNMIMSDAVDFLGTISTQEQKILEEIILKGLMLFSDERLSTSNIEKMSDLIDVTVKLWPELRKVLIGLKHHRLEFMSMMNELMDSLVENPVELDRLIKEMVESNLLNAKDLEKLLLNDEVLISQLTRLLDQAMKTKQMSSDLNWLETLKNMFAQPDFEWDALKSWLAIALKDHPDKLTVSLLIEFLGEKNGDKYRLKDIMDELFLNHREMLQDFLRETFPALRFKPE